MLACVASALLHGMAHVFNMLLLPVSTVERRTQPHPVYCRASYATMQGISRYIPYLATYSMSGHTGCGDHHRIADGECEEEVHDGRQLCSGYGATGVRRLQHLHLPHQLRVWDDLLRLREGRGVGGGGGVSECCVITWSVNGQTGLTDHTAAERPRVWGGRGRAVGHAPPPPPPPALWSACAGRWSCGCSSWSDSSET